MASITFAVDEELKRRLSKFLWINLSELVREELIKKEEKLRMVKEFEEIISKSKLTEEDAKKLADEINKSLAKRYSELLKRKS